MDWLKRLREVPDGQRVVQHRPETDRYARARLLLRYVVRAAAFLGSRMGDSGDEIAVWCAPASGRGHGYYACFRFIEHERTTWAVLFCFYDGTESSPGFRSVGAAASHAAQYGFSQDWES